MIDPIPIPFPSMRILPLPTGTVFHRIHNRAFGPDNFNPGLGRGTRFAPLRPGPDPVPTMYGSEELECAIFETVLHDIPVPSPATVSVPWSQVDLLDHSTLKSTRPLRLAQLREPDLNRIGLRRSDLITTDPSQYPKTAAWALALHDAHPHVDGLLWTSRACDPHWAAVLFGTRVVAGDLALEEHEAIRDCPRRLDAVRLACLRVGAFVAW
jgi:hypothetical protein